MALSVTSLTSGTSTANQASYTTAPVALATGQLVVVSTCVSVGTAPADEPTITGPGTLVSKDTRWAVNSARGVKTQIFAVTAGGTGGFTITGTAYTSGAWSIYRINGADPTTPVVQGTTATGSSAGSPAAFSITLGTGLTAGNGVIGAFGAAVNELSSPAAGATEIHDIQMGTTPAGALETQYAFGTAGTISRVGTSVTTGAGVTTQSGTVVSGVAVGDLIIVSTSWSIGTSPTWGESSYTGWTIAEDMDDTTIQTRVLYRIADGSGTDSPPAATTTVSANRVTTVAVYRGVDTASPFVVEGGTVQSASSTTQSAPSLNNTNANAWGVYAGAARQVSTPLSWTAGTGLTEQRDAESAVANTNNVAAQWADSNGTVATGSRTYSGTTSAATAKATMWAAFLKPASGATSTLTASWTTTGLLRATIAEIKVAGSNAAPVVFAGADQSAGPFPNVVSLSGTVTDDGLPSGTLTQAWTMTSGPGTVVFDDATAAVTTATFSTSGTYVLRLTGSDGTLTAYDELTVTINVAPALDNIAANPSLVYIPNATVLSADVSGEDGFPAAIALTWSQVSGPGTTTFVNGSSNVTEATFSVAGTYVLRLTATDTSVSVSKDVTVTAVAVPTNAAPTVSAGPDQGPTPNFTVNLVGTAADDGNPVNQVTKIWSQVSGPGTVAFGDARSLITSATFSDPGTHVLRLTVTDGQYSVFDDATITVDLNAAPVVSAGPDQTIVLPSSVSLSGSANDDGLPTGVLGLTWSKVSGPGTVTFTDATAAVTTASFSADGTYVLRLTADDGALQTADDITVTVQAAPVANTAPVVNAGVDGSVTLPSTYSLVGSYTDDGLPIDTVTTLWSKVSGPGTVTFGNSALLSTTATFSVAGTYVLRLTADDSALQGFDELTITVAAAPPPTNVAPTVSAGIDKSVTMPTAMSLVGTASDDGLPSGGSLVTTWSKLSGPAGGVVTFGNAHALSTTATFSVAGTYVLRLSATDGQLTTTDDMTATVSAATPPPPTSALPYTSGSFFKSRVDGASTPISSTRTSQFHSFMATNIDQKAITWPKLNISSTWAMSYHVGKSTDPIWKLTGGNTSDPKLQILQTQGFHMADSVADTFPTGTQDRPGCMIDPVFGYTCQFADSVPNKTTRTISVSAAGIMWHSSNGLDYRNGASTDSRNFTSRGRICDAMIVRRDTLDWAIANNTGLGHVLHLFFVETNAADGSCHPMVGFENQSGWGAEGERIRLKPSIDLQARGLTGAMLAIGRTLQQNGAYLGDNSGSSTQIKCAQPQFYTGTNVSTDGFQGKITWADFEVVQQGWQ